MTRYVDDQGLLLGASDDNTARLNGKGNTTGADVSTRFTAAGRLV